MRVNIYSQEFNYEVQLVDKGDESGARYRAVMFVLHSSLMLHHPPASDDRSGVTFWLPKSQARREEMAKAFEQAAHLCRTAGPE